MAGRSLVIVFALSGVAAAGLPGAPAPGRRSVASRVRAKLRGYWQERDPNLPKDKQVGPNGGITWEIFPDYCPGLARLTDFENEAQQWGGDGVLNVKPDPMWLDVRFTDAGRERVQLGIFKFDGGRVLWVRGDWVEAKAYDAARGDLPARPRKFTSPKGRPLYTVLERIK